MARRRKKCNVVAALKDAVVVPVETLDERLTSAQANRVLIQGGVRRDNAKRRWTRQRRRFCYRAIWMGF